MQKNWIDEEAKVRLKIYGWMKSNYNTHIAQHLKKEK